MAGTWNPQAYAASVAGGSPPPSVPSPQAAPVAPAGGNAPKPSGWDPAGFAQAADAKQHQLTAPVDQAVRGGALAALSNTAGKLLDPINNVLGAPQRGVAGAATAFSGGHPEQMLLQAGDAIMHPDKPQYEQGLEKAMHVDQLRDNSANPNLLGRIRNFGVDTGTQMATDPLNLLGVGMVRKGLEGAGAVAKAIPGIEHAGEFLNDKTASIRNAIDPTQGAAAAMGHGNATKLMAAKNKAEQRAREIIDASPQKPVDQKAYNDLLDKTTKTIMLRDVPEQFGFNTPHYQELAKKLPDMPEAPAKPPPLRPVAGTTGRVVPRVGSFGSVPPEGPRPRIEPPTAPGMTRQTALGRATEQVGKYEASTTKHGRVNAVTYDSTYKVPDDVKDLLRDNPDAQQYLEPFEKLAMPKAVHDILMGQQEVQSKVAPKFLAQFSNVLKDVMFLNPVPHMKNVTAMVLQSPGGAGVFARGMKYFLQSNTPGWQQKALQLSQIGADSPFLKEREGLFGKLGSLPGVLGLPGKGIDWLSSKAHDALWKYDKSMRMAMVDQQMGLGRNADDAAAYTLDHLIDYSNQSKLAQTLHQWGAPFPHWRIASPLRQARGLIENPAAVERQVRVEQNANSDLIPQGSGYKVNLETPLDEAAKAFNPATTAEYAAGVLPEEMRAALPLMDPQHYKEGWQDLAQDPTRSAADFAIGSFVPGGETAQDLLENTFHSKASGPTRFGAGILGGFAQNDPSAFTKLVEQYRAISPDMGEHAAEKAALRQLSQQKRALAGGGVGR